MDTPPALLSTYLPLAARVGRRVRCLYRRAWCKVTSWTDAPIPWPRVLPAGGRGHPGLLVTAELRRAIKTESAEALKHHFGVSTLVAWKLRKWAGVEGHTRTAGSRRLHQEVSDRGAVGMKAKVWTAAELDARSELAKRLGRTVTGRWDEDGWTPEQDALLGTDHDDAIAARIGRTKSAVTTRRVRRKIPAFRGWTRGSPGWTAEEVALLGTDFDEAIAARVGWSVGAVVQKRQALKMKVFRDRRRG
jgi:hypothetical protein